MNDEGILKIKPLEIIVTLAIAVVLTVILDLFLFGVSTNFVCCCGFSILAFITLFCVVYGVVMVIRIARE